MHTNVRVQRVKKLWDYNDSKYTAEKYIKEKNPSYRFS